MFSNIAHAMAAPPGGGSEGAGGMLTSFLPLIFIFGIFYFLLIRPQQKKAKEHKETLQSIKKGDKVITSGGIHGLVEDITDDVLTLKVGVKDDTKIKVNRNYIAGLREKE